MPVKRTIIAAGEGDRYEFMADAAVSPGDLIIQTTTGCIRHATAAAKPGALFAIENEIFGNGVEVDYAANDRVLAEACEPGMMVNVTIAPAAAAIVAGNFLESAGNGTLRYVVTAATAIAVADEAVDNSAGGTKTHVRARIIG